MGFGNDQIEDVDPLHLLIRGAEILDQRLRVIPRVGVEIGATFHREGLGHAMIWPAIQFMRDAAPGFQAEPRNGAEHQNIDADAVLQRVQNRFDALVYEADRADLNADEFLIRVGDHIAHAAAPLWAAMKDLIRAMASLITGSGCR